MPDDDEIIIKYIRLYSQAVDIDYETLRRRDSRTGFRYAALACVWEGLGEFRNALESLERAWEVLVFNYGQNQLNDSGLDWKLRQIREQSEQPPRR